MIQNSWSELEAEALEAYQFRLAGDPRIEWSINMGRIEAAQLLGIVQYYKFEGERLPCSLCGRALHHGGAVVQLRDFTLRLVGQCCGRRHFRECWSEQSNAFRSAERAAGYRIKAREILARRDLLERECIALRPPIEEQELSRRALKIAFADSFVPLARESFRGVGRLSYGEMVSSTLTEQGAKGGLRTIQKDTAPLSGAAMFSLIDKRKRLESTISKMRTNLNEMSNALDSGRSLFPCLRRHDDCVRETLAIIDDYNAGLGYIDVRNADIISFWFQKIGIQKAVQITNDGWLVVSPTATRSLPWRVFERLAFPPTLYGIAS